MAKKILVVDDEKKIVDIIAYNLKKDGYEVLTAYGGEDGLNAAILRSPDLILLDIMMPGMDGFEVCRRIREKFDTPIIMLTARADEVDKVLGLEWGADDYVTKPFGVRELMARVKANLRRTGAAAGNAAGSLSMSMSGHNSISGLKSKSRLIIGDLDIDMEHYEVLKRDVLVELTLREFELLKFLATQKNQIFSREYLLEHVWGYEFYGDVRTVDVTVRRLREKIEDDPSHPGYILTKRGIGYYFANIS